jgi:Tol biopolymer transport system component
LEAIVVKSQSVAAFLVTVVLAAAAVLIPLSAGAAPAPSGKIAFVRTVGGNGHIYILNAAGTKAVDVSKASALWPAWSPDGKKLAFVSDRATGGLNSQLYVMNADGSNPTRVTHNAMVEVSPTWSPDGKRIAFAGDDGIFVVTLSSKKVERLTKDLDGDPAWSPDGATIVFSRLKSVSDPSSTTGSSDEGDLWVMAADGSQPRQLTSPPPSFSDSKTTIEGDDDAPSWSPDGTKLAFEGNRDSNYGIYVMNADGSNVVALTHPPGIDTFPTWSGDGAQIAFARTATPTLSSKSQIYVMNADGSNQAALGDPDATTAAWQPGQ